MADKRIIELANRIYDLDGKVYEATGSNLGRVYHGDKTKCINDIVEILSTGSAASKVRSELALISNMARTVKDTAMHKVIMREYGSIVDEAMDIQNSLGSDILNPEAAELNMSNLANRFGTDDNLIICIGRAFGCAGTDIGFKLADKLRISYYDVSIMNEMLERGEQQSGRDYLERELFQTTKSRTPADWFRDFKKYHGLSRSDVQFFDTSRKLVELAKQEPYVVMGRYADNILSRNHIPHISIFITAPRNLRIQRTYQVGKDKLTYAQAAKLVIKEDKAHLRRYAFYTGKRWGVPDNYDLTINSASYGVEGSVDLIMRVIAKNSNKG